MGCKCKRLNNSKTGCIIPVVQMPQLCAAAVVYQSVGSSMKTLAGEATRKCEALESAQFNRLCNSHLNLCDQIDRHPERSCLSA